MKRRRSPCPSPHGDSDTEKLTFSRSELKKMIEEAVLSGGNAREERYESALYKLEEHIKKVKRRGNAAFAYIRKLGISGDSGNKQDKQLPSLAVEVKVDRSVLWTSVDSAEKPYLPIPIFPDPSEPCTKRSEDDPMTMELHDKKHIKILEDRTKSIQEMDADTEAFKTIIRKLKEEPLSPTKQSTLSDTSHSPQNNSWIKTENPSPGHSPTHDEMQVEGEDRKPLWIQQHSAQMDDYNYPPFPDTPFPLALNWEAASYNIPQAPTIQAAIINYPAGLSIYWSIEEKDALTIDCYSVFRTVEDAKGSGVFKEWEKVKEVAARDVPMYLSQTKLSTCRPDYKAGFTVVGKDRFGRYGPFSNIIFETHPAVAP